MALLYSSFGLRLVSARYEAEGLPIWSRGHVLTEKMSTCHSAILGPEMHWEIQN
jgi:hypothetical protein